MCWCLFFWKHTHHTACSTAIFFSFLVSWNFLRFKKHFFTIFSASCSSHYLLRDSRVRRIIVPTTCCTRLVLRAGDLLLHRSFSSIYLKQKEKSEQRCLRVADMTTKKQSTSGERMKESGRIKSIRNHSLGLLYLFLESVPGLSFSSI